LTVSAATGTTHIQEGKILRWMSCEAPLSACLHVFPEREDRYGEVQCHHADLW